MTGDEQHRRAAQSRRPARTPGREQGASRSRQRRSPAAHGDPQAGDDQDVQDGRPGPLQAAVRPLGSSRGHLGRSPPGELPSQAEDQLDLADRLAGRPGDRLGRGARVGQLPDRAEPPAQLGATAVGVRRRGAPQVRARRSGSGPHGGGSARSTAGTARRDATADTVGAGASACPIGLGRRQDRCDAVGQRRSRSIRRRHQRRPADRRGGAASEARPIAIRAAARSHRVTWASECPSLAAREPVMAGGSIQCAVVVIVAVRMVVDLPMCRRLAGRLRRGRRRGRRRRPRGAGRPGSAATRRSRRARG